MSTSIARAMNQKWTWQPVIKPKREGLLNLSSNTLMHPELKQLQKNFLSSINDFSSYPSYDTLRNHCASHYQINHNNIGFTAGSDNLIAMLMQIARDLNLRQIFLQQPYYYNYKTYADSLLIETCYLRFENLLLPETIQLLSQTNPSLIFLISPCPMTGIALDSDQLDSWLNRIEAYGHFVVLDQAYAGFGSELQLSLLKKYNHLFIFQTFSKCFGAAGMRFCFYWGQPNLVARLKHWGIENTISSIAAQYALFVLNHLDAFTKIRQDICKWRNDAYTYLQHEYPTLLYYNSLANFVSLYLEKAQLIRFIETAHIKQKIFLKHHINNGDSHCLRFTVTTPDILQLVYDVFAEVFPVCHPI